jgi:hypothetical protein
MLGFGGMRRMGLLGFAFLILGCRGESAPGPSTVPSSFPSTRPTTLANYLDRPIDDGELQELSKRYKDLTGENLGVENDLLAPGKVACFHSGPAEYILLRNKTLLAGPAIYHFEAIVFDRAWRKLHRAVLLSGYRSEMPSVTIEPNDIVGSDLLVVRTQPSDIFLFMGMRRSPAFVPES